MSDTTTLTNNMDDQAQNDPLFPIAVLIDELKVRHPRTASCILCPPDTYGLYSMTMSFFV